MTQKWRPASAEIFACEIKKEICNKTAVKQTASLDLSQNTTQAYKNLLFNTRDDFEMFVKIFCIQPGVLCAKPNYFYLLHYIPAGKLWPGGYKLAQYSSYRGVLYGPMAQAISHPRRKFWLRPVYTSGIVKTGVILACYTGIETIAVWAYRQWCRGQLLFTGTLTASALARDYNRSLGKKSQK